MSQPKRLGVGFVGSGFVTRFHIRSFVGVRDADVAGVWSPNPAHAAQAARLARELGVGDARAFPSLAALVEAPGKRKARPGSLFWFEYRKRYRRRNSP